MDKDICGTPFPTGLFKSRVFLQKVRKALGYGSRKAAMPVASLMPPPLPSARAAYKFRLSHLRAQKSRFKVKDPPTDGLHQLMHCAPRHHLLSAAGSAKIRVKEGKVAKGLRALRA